MVWPSFWNVSSFIFFSSGQVFWRSTWEVSGRRQRAGTGPALTALFTIQKVRSYGLEQGIKFLAYVSKTANWCFCTFLCVHIGDCCRSPAWTKQRSLPNSRRESGRGQPKGHTHRHRHWPVYLRRQLHDVRRKNQENHHQLNGRRSPSSLIFLVLFPVSWASIPSPALWTVRPSGRPSVLLAVSSTWVDVSLKFLWQSQLLSPALFPPSVPSTPTLSVPLWLRPSLRPGLLAEGCHPVCEPGETPWMCWLVSGKKSISCFAVSALSALFEHLPDSLCWLVSFLFFFWCECHLEKNYVTLPSSSGTPSHHRDPPSLWSLIAKVCTIYSLLIKLNYLYKVDALDSFCY